MAVRLPRRLGNEEVAGLVDHLGELRARVAVSAIALVSATVVAYVFHAQIIEWLNAPLPASAPEPVTLGVTEPFMTSLKISLYAGFALALPVILWQFWSFLAPALDRGAQRAIGALVAFGAVLLVLGIGFGYSVALPAAVHFLTDFDKELYNIEIRASSYYSFALLTLLSVGVVFQLPIFILGLVRLGITSSARLRRNRRLGYVIVTAVAVLLPGVDPLTTLIELVPLLLLFEGSIWLSVLLERRWRTSAQPAVGSVS
ncbi:MAG: twin-arginine translocase subunit TatC [Actinobacteria bacterium]|nr:twin-arginine translocase subunit TatC [Actinomycetota bacterium]